MRDKLKSKEYFLKYNEEEDDDINFYKNNLENGKIKEDRIDSIKEQIARKEFDLLIARYSMGSIINGKFIEDFKPCIFDFNIYWNSSSGYVQMIWMLSIGIMLDVDASEFNKLKELVERDDPKDYLVDFLLSQKADWGTIHNAFKFPTPYQSLLEVITLARENKREEAVALLKTYLEKEWYKGHSDTGWYDSHKSKHNTYYGYWSWESGALVKILKLDDSILKDQQYYPYDMVHWED